MMDMAVTENTWGGPTVEILILALKVWIQGAHHYHGSMWLPGPETRCAQAKAGSLNSKLP